MRFYYQAIILVLAITTIPGILKAQITEHQDPYYWEKIYGGTNDDGAGSIEPTADGNFIIIGSTSSFGAAPYSNVYLIKIDAEGNELWSKTLGGIDPEGAGSGQQTTEGGFIIVGNIYDVSNAWESDVLLIKTNTNGNQLWSKTFIRRDSDDGAFEVQQTTDGGYVIAGSTYYFSTESTDAFLMKTDANGNQLWRKTFGGNQNYFGRSVQQADDGGYIITGGTDAFGTGESDVFLIKTNANGNQQWAKTFGIGDHDVGHSVQQTDDGGYIITGGTGITWLETGESDAFLIKTNTNGNQLWSNTFGGTNNESGKSVKLTDDGSYIINAWTRSYGAGKSDVYLIKTDANGNQLWSKTFGGTDHDYGGSVQLTDDGGYIIAGYTYSFGTGPSDVYLIYYNYEHDPEEYWTPDRMRNAVPPPMGIVVP